MCDFNNELYLLELRKKCEGGGGGRVCVCLYICEFSLEFRNFVFLLFNRWDKPKTNFLAGVKVSVCKNVVDGTLDLSIKKTIWG